MIDVKNIYTISNGALRVFTVLNEHYLCEGASQETYLCKDENGRKFVCSKDMYHYSAKKAWAEYLGDLKDNISYANQKIQELQQTIAEMTKEAQSVKEIIEKL